VNSPILMKSFYIIKYVRFDEYAVLFIMTIMDIFDFLFFFRSIKNIKYNLLYFYNIIILFALWTRALRRALAINAVAATHHSKLIACFFTAHRAIAF